MSAGKSCGGMVSTMSRFLSTGALLLVILPRIIVAQSSISHGPSDVDGHYPIGDERLVLMAITVNDCQNNRCVGPRIDAAAAKGKTHRWDNRWRYWALPADREKYLLVAPGRTSTREIGATF